MKIRLAIVVVAALIFSLAISAQEKQVQDPAGEQATEHADLRRPAAIRFEGVQARDHQGIDAAR
jgi:hypothetical protein